MRRKGNRTTVGSKRSKARQKHVKIRVRQKAIQLREFTARQLVEATGLKDSSVQTELQRMKHERLLSVRRLDAGPDVESRVLYSVVDSERALQKLWDSVPTLSLS